MTDALKLQDFDQTIPPTEDLYLHANGGFLTTAQIPEDRSSWGSFMELRVNAEKAVHDIITSMPTDSQIGALFASFMDEERIEELGTAPLQPLLERVDAITSVADLARHFGWSIRNGVNSLFDFDNDSDPGNPQRYLMFVGQSGIGLPDEEYYRLDEHAEHRAQYLAHIEKMFELAGFADAAEQAAAAFDLETRIAAAHWDKVRTRDMVEMYHLQNWDDFVAESPALLWDDVLAGAELPTSAVAEIINAQRTFLPDVVGLVTEEELPNWRAWARWQLINGFSSLLNSDLVEQDFDFYSRTLNGIPQIRDRWKRGVSFTEAALGEVIGQEYVARHFPTDTKAKADALVANLIEAYRRSISDLDWMGEETRTEALEKLAKFTPKIGYPNKWRDFSALEVRADDLLGNAMRSASFDFDHTIEQLSGPVDREEWFMYPQTVNAYYHPLRNEIVFPAAILQSPFFDPDADDAVNYGGIGAVIGHEIGHGFDDQGSTADGDGRLRNWWTDADLAAFEERTAALVGQYSVLSPREAPEVKVNGELTLGENIGDLGGLNIAYLAWQISLEGKELPEDEDGYTPAQRFFLNWAKCWQQLIRPEAARERVAVDPHSPAEIRCNQVSMNVDAFHDAFGTQPGDAMWMSPEDRVKIW